MSSRERRPPLWLIWSVPAAFGVVQAIAWTMAGGIPRRPLVLVQVAAAWAAMLVLAFFASQRIGRLTRRLTQKEDAHLATLDEVEQLLTQNAILQVIARSVDVPLAFQSLASRIVRIVPCDRVGLALLTPDRQEFQTYTARVREEERRARPRPEIVFKAEGTIIGSVVRSREPVIIRDTSTSAADFLDVNVLHSAGFTSAIVLPLISKGLAVGTLNIVSRKPDAFHSGHITVLEPIAEIFAVAYVAQQLQIGLSKYRTMETMSELTLAVAAEINSALQIITGHCDLIERGYPDPHLQRDLATITRQAQRITGLLEKMRTLANDRMKEAAQSVSYGTGPQGPHAYIDPE
jgi:transcriptional regulator with GAF, ATPase, and Fis domain